MPVALIVDDTLRVLRRVGAGTEAGLAEELLSGEQYVIGDGDDSTHYVVDVGGALTQLPRMPAALTPSRMVIAADGLDTVTFEALPDPCTLEIDDVEQVVVGGAFAFLTIVEGGHLIRFSREYVSDYVSIEAQPLAVIQVRAKADVDRQAGEVRTKFGTFVPFQETVYLEKRAEAEVFKTDPAPDPTNYQMLADRAALKGVTLDAVADEWLLAASRLRVVLVDVEKKREAAKQSITDATTVDEILAAQAVAWPQPV